MRNILPLCDGWTFTKEDREAFRAERGEGWETVTLPHTWNAGDACEGSTAYYRGACWYQRVLTTRETPAGQQVFLEFGAANEVAEVYVGGKLAGEHKGGFSVFRFEISDLLDAGGETLISVRVDNSAREDVYPQMADFTFFGGLYREARLIGVTDTYFDLSDDGADGVYIAAEPAEGGAAKIAVRARTVGSAGCTVRCDVMDGRRVAATGRAPAGKLIEITLQNARLWNARDPYLYTMRVQLLRGEETFDKLDIPFGVRSIEMRGEAGFFLNGERVQLRGVSRHQDREGKGWALSRADMEEDMALIREIGANSIRLAHYQHHPYFYDLCDREGMVVWAEIPFISAMLPGEAARGNTMTQMRELIKQNYNHPAICMWGISNEITIQGEREGLGENLAALDSLCHSLDASRPTTCAHVLTMNVTSPLSHVTDTCAYNLYYGWYGGVPEDFAGWFEAFQRGNPGVSVGCSEYGAEGVLQYHADNPRRGDYSEEYQEECHRRILEVFEKTPILWGSYVWNMFDFSSKMRDEGGRRGMNNKGLVTYDRRTKKDAFYLYKAHWSDEPFVHIGSRRYVRRAAERIAVRVHSNCARVELRVNGELFGAREGGRLFEFEDVPLAPGLNEIAALGDGAQEDRVTFERVDTPDERYIFEGGREDAKILSWFEDGGIAPEGFYSVKDTCGDLLENPATRDALAGIFGDMLNNPMIETAKSLPLETIYTFMKSQIPFEAVQALNSKLNRIPRA